MTKYSVVKTDGKKDLENFTVEAINLRKAVEKILTNKQKIYSSSYDDLSGEFQIAKNNKVLFSLTVKKITT